MVLLTVSGLKRSVRTVRVIMTSLKVILPPVLENRLIVLLLPSKIVSITRFRRQWIMWSYKEVKWPWDWSLGRQDTVQTVLSKILTRVISQGTWKFLRSWQHPAVQTWISIRIVMMRLVLVKPSKTAFSWRWNRITPGIGTLITLVTYPWKK